MVGLSIAEQFRKYASAPETLYFKEGRLRLSMALLVAAILSGAMAWYTFDRYGNLHGNAVTASILFVVYFLVGFPGLILVELRLFVTPRGTLSRASIAANLLWAASLLALLLVIPFLLPATGGWVYFVGIGAVLGGTGVTYTVLYLKIRSTAPPQRDWSLPVDVESLWPRNQLLQLRDFESGSAAIVVLTRDELLVGNESRPMMGSEEDVAIDGIERFGGYGFYPGKISDQARYRPADITRVAVNLRFLRPTIVIWVGGTGAQEKRVFRGNRFDNPVSISVLALKGMQRRILNPNKSIREHARRIMAYQIEHAFKVVAPQALLTIRMKAPLPDETASQLAR